jgi:hypothetical protein
MQAIRQFVVVAVIATAVAVFTLPSQVLGHGNERGTATASIRGGTVAIEYGRPTLKGRDLLSQITPGSYWRLGADTPTTLTTDVGLTLGGQSVAPGKYTLLLKFLGDDKWSLIVADGVTPRTWQPQKVVAEAALATAKMDASVEALTIKLSSQENRGSLTIEWGETQMATEFAAA